VTGTVIDDTGEPVAGVTVRALQLRTVGDLVMAATAPGGGARQTDDRGRYRIFGLLPGRYLISASADAGVASPDPDGTYGYAPVFYPATHDVAAASTLEIGGAGEGDRTGVNLVFVRSRTHTISGFAFDAAGRAANEVVVFPSQRSSRIMLEPRRQAVAPDGAFSVSNVPAGEYVVQVIARSANTTAGPGGTAPIEFGMRYLTVSDRAPGPVTVRATRGSIVEGQIAAREGGEVPDVTLWPLPTDFDRSPIAGSGPAGFSRLEDGRFRVIGVTGPRRFEVRGAPDGWYLASLTVNGQDALNSPFDFGLEGRPFTDVEAVLSSGGAGISGRVVDARDAAITDYSVVVFAADPAQWFRSSQQLKASRSDRDGRFRFSGLPPGDYFVSALDVLEGSPGGGGEWQNPAVLEELSSRAQRITLAEREVHRGTFRLLER
jgi:hypothetical protein